ncbi:MAG TPA: MBL fold metallo-hydrolase [Candidatus Polarisedimenticolaceae bacterium]|nr:MBL fold metallo-hydrolase [Candidatus Polarisedimenticolaceae bacterium]
MGVRVVPLGSGSRGNSTLVEADGSRVLVDAGLSGRTLVQRLDGIGIAPQRLTAIVLSHEHSDHAMGAERLSKRFGVPLVCSRATLDALDRSHRHFADWVELRDGEELDLDGVSLTHFPIPHDAAKPVGFVLRAGGVRIGIATDLGHATTLVVERLRGCEVLMIESNHDERMLRDGPYPWQLKQRVASRMGHLSNGDAARLVRAVAGPDCRALVLAHLSEKNNTPELARAAATRALAEAGANRVTMRVASSRRPTPPLELR